MVAKLLISQSTERRREEISKLLAFHLRGGGTNHPDLLYFPSDSKLGVESAKKIKDHYSLKPYSAKGRIVVLEDGGELTVEAQNALLKTIEELPKDSLFIIGAESEAKFLPTVLSRCETIYIQNPTSHRTHTSEVGYEKDIEKLLESTVEERFEYVEKLKDKEEFLQSLLAYFHDNLASYIGSGNTDYKDFLKELLQAEKWQKQNVNIRGILEYLMLVMPTSRI